MFCASHPGCQDATLSYSLPERTDLFILHILIAEVSSGQEVPRLSLWNQWSSRLEPLPSHLNPFNDPFAKVVCFMVAVAAPPADGVTSCLVWERTVHTVKSTKGVNCKNASKELQFPSPHCRRCSSCAPGRNRPLLELSSPRHCLAWLP